MIMSECRINLSRLRKNLEELARFGQGHGGGISRLAFSETDMKARAWLMEKIEEARLHARMDAAGNVFGRLGHEGPAVLSGSHLDTVPDGGMFDGALGVLAALECLQTIQEKGLSLSWPLEMVAFSDEEGAYLGFLGSRAMMGSLTQERLESAHSVNGQPLDQALATAGLDIRRISQARRDPKQIRFYLELHIEQGPVLESNQISIGLVRSITGIGCYWVTFTGEPDHAGTTPLYLRRDAFLGAAEFSLRVHDWVRSNTSGVVNVGKIDLSPGAFNIVPGRSQLTLEFRSSSGEELVRMEKSILKLGREIAQHRNLTFSARKGSWELPVVLSGTTMRVIKEGVDDLGYASLLMDSGAGHDAQILAQGTETGMIFIPSLRGKSHAPEEACTWDDVERGTTLLLHSLLRLAHEENRPV